MTKEWILARIVKTIEYYNFGLKLKVLNCDAECNITYYFGIKGSILYNEAIRNRNALIEAYKIIQKDYK